MNKYLSLLIFTIFLFGSGWTYANFFRPKEIGGVKPTGKIIEINMRVLRDKWRWDPAEIKIRAGDKVRLKIYNEDTYDHGFAIDIYGVNRRLFPKTETLIEFTASLVGKFKYYCSVPCGEGHYDQIGTMFVAE